MITGERVKQARELRALTQTDLAERAGVTQSTVAHVENGRLTPSEEFVAAVALQTGFPPSFFRQPEPESFPLGTLLLFRARSSASAREEAQVRRYAQTIFGCAERLGQKVTKIPLRLPRIVEAPDIAAHLTRDALGLSPDVPIDDLVNSLEKAGVLIFRLPVDIARIDAFSVWAGQSAERPVIALVGRKPVDRMRFSVAHEVGHLVMHHSMRGDVAGIEREADLFAAQLLLPQSAMQQEMAPPVTLSSLASLKRRWRVSMQALIVRASELEIITVRQKTYLFQKLSKMGMRKAEPVELRPEFPRALGQMAEMLYGTPVDFEKAAADLRLTESFVRQVIEFQRELEPSPLADTGNRGENVIAFPARTKMA